MKVLQATLPQEVALGEGLMRTAEREVACLERFHHPHIVQLLGYNLSIQVGKCGLVYELATAGSVDMALTHVGQGESACTSLMALPTL